MAKKATARRSRRAAIPKKFTLRGARTAYEKRIARGLAAGKTLQEARGHKPREHIERREREERAGETTYQRGKIKEFAEQQAKKSDPPLDVDAVNAELRAMMRQHGFAAFNQLKAEVNRLRKLKRLRPERRRGRRRTTAAARAAQIIDLSAAIERANAQKARNVAAMTALADRLGIDFRLLFYH